MELLPDFVRSTYVVDLVQAGDGPKLQINFDWVGSPTRRGLSAGCDIRAARFVGTARPASS